jgi:type I restriction enzyme S subunit
MEVKLGYKQTELGVIPEDWENCVLTQICDRISVGLATSVTKHYRKDGVPIVRNLNIKDGYFDDEDMLYISPEFAKANSTKSAKGLDVLTVHTGSNLGQTCVLPAKYDGCHTFTTLITTPSKAKLDPAYLCHHMSSFYGRREMKRLEVGGGKGNLNTGDLKKYRIAAPPVEEQRAIAAALSDVDALLAKFDRLIAKKRDIKQAAMQQLITGKKRLPGFRGEWEVKKFGEIASPRRERIDPRKSGEQLFCIELEHIEQGTGRLIGSSIADRSSSLRSVFRADDVLFGKLRAYLRKYWRADRNGVCSTEIWALVPNSEFVTSMYLYHLVTVDSFIDAATTAYGTHMPRSDWNVIKNYEMSLPKLPEQTAIASVLSDMDVEIAALEARRNKTRALKQGMMQELLTGRIRLV